MIMTMVDAENRMVLYKFNGNGLEELAALRVVTDDPTELAQIAMTLALMAGETNGATPSPRTVTASASPRETDRERKKRLDRERHARRRQEQKELTAAGAPEQRRFPSKTKTKKNVMFDTDYTPTPGTAIHRILEEVATHGPLTGNDVAAALGANPASVSASLSSDLIKRGVVTVEARVNDNGRSVGWYSITDHGRAVLARSRTNG